MKIYRIARKSSMEILKENKIPLTDDERAKCLKEKAVWHHGPNGEESPAVWKSKNSKGKITYVTNTHRAYNTADTLEGCIKKFHDFIKSTAGTKITMIKTASVTDSEFRDLKTKVDKVKDDVQDVKRDHKDFDNRIKRAEKTIDELNVGRRQFWQEKTVFTSLQRKLEQLEKMEQEWIRYKEDLSDSIKKQIEQNTRASIRSLVPKR